nr:glycosyltransferase family 2 protein [Microbacterium bovistercoris]
MVVPTYRSTAHLDALVASLDAQTLPQHELEVLLIDDGSPDDTPARLDAFGRDRENYRVIRLPPSGWPSRPRNEGIDRAQGRYVVFLDHDDRLFPDALRAACALADRTGADVVDGKESKSNTPGWAMRDVTTDVDNAIDWIDPHPLVPMNPHKMFRTAFLRENGIRFPEGGRQIWEDIAFDIAAHARARVISLMVSTPFYLWHRPEHDTTSATFHDDLDEYLDAVARVFRWIDEELQQPRFGELLPRFRAYQLRMRVLPLFRWDHRTEAQRERIRAFAAELLPRVPDDADRHLDPWRRIGIALARAGRFDLIARHMPTWPRLDCTPVAGPVRWTDGGLAVAVDLTWRFDTTEPSAVIWHDGRAVLALDPEVARFAGEHALTADVTADLEAATYAVDRRSRTQKIDWMLGHGVSARLQAGSDGEPVLATAQLALRWDVADDGPGRLHDGPWDLYLRTALMSTRVVRRVRTETRDRTWAIVAGRPAAAYRAQNGGLSVDVGQSLFGIVDDPRTTASVQDGQLVVDLPHVTVLSPAEVRGRLETGGRVVGECRLVVEDGRARVRGALPARPGMYAIVFGTTRSRLRVQVHRSGRVGVRHEPRRSARGILRSAARRIMPHLPASLQARLSRGRRRG